MVQMKLISCSNWAFPFGTHQEAHKVKGKDSRHPSERQALEHCTANSGRVTIIPGGGIGLQRRAAR